MNMRTWGSGGGPVDYAKFAKQCLGSTGGNGYQRGQSQPVPVSTHI